MSSIENKEAQISAAQERISGALYLLHLLDPHDTVRRAMHEMQRSEDLKLIDEIANYANSLDSLESAEAYMRGAGFAYLYTKQLLHEFGKERSLLTDSRIASVNNKRHKQDLEDRANRLVSAPFLQPTIEERKATRLASEFDPPLLAVLQLVTNERPVTDTHDISVEVFHLVGAHRVIELTEITSATPTNAKLEMQPQDLQVQSQQQ